VQESHFLGLLLIHQEIDSLAFITEFTLRVDDLCIDIYQIADLLCDLGPNGQLWLCSRNSFLELNIQLNGIATGLQLAGNHPSTYFINQCAQYAAMHGVYPSLIIVLWIPFAHDIVAILIELQMKSDGIARTTAKAVVLRMVAPRVYYLLHISSKFSCFLVNTRILIRTSHVNYEECHQTSSVG